jgi:hypothetical protein
MIRGLMKRDYSAATAVMLANAHQTQTPINLSPLSQRVNMFLRRTIELLIAILSRERIDELVKIIEVLPYHIGMPSSNVAPPLCFYIIILWFCV